MGSDKTIAADGDIPQNQPAILNAVAEQMRIGADARTGTNLDEVMGRA